MKKDRRNFIKLAGVAGISLAGNSFYNPENLTNEYKSDAFMAGKTDSMISGSQEAGTSLIGLYGSWAAGLIEKDLPSMSFRRQENKNVEKWKKKAKKRLSERLGIPDIGGIPSVIKVKEYTYDGLHIEELKVAASIRTTHRCNIAETNECKRQTSRNSWFS